MDMPNTLLQLHGLKALARRHNDALEEIAKAAMELTGEKDDGGHCADFAYDKQRIAGNAVGAHCICQRH